MDSIKNEVGETRDSCNTFCLSTYNLLNFQVKVLKLWNKVPLLITNSNVSNFFCFIFVSRFQPFLIGCGYFCDGSRMDCDGFDCFSLDESKIWIRSLMVIILQKNNAVNICSHNSSLHMMACINKEINLTKFTFWCYFIFKKMNRITTE